MTFVLRGLFVGLFFILVAFSTSAVPTVAQDTSTGSPLIDVDQILVKRLSSADGLPSRGMSLIMQDRQGFMWIGTTNGLARYDGVEFRIYAAEPDNPNSLNNNWIHALFQDQADYIWIGSDGGLARFDPRTERFTNYTNDPENPQSLSDNTVQAIYEDHAGTLWVGTHGGLNRFDPATETFTRYQNDPDEPTTLSNNNIYKIYEDSLNNLWIPTYGGGLDLLDRQTGVFTHYQHDPEDADSLSSNNVYTMYEDRENNLWIGTWGGGLDRFEREQGKFIHYPANTEDPTALISPNVNDILEDWAGNLWVATFGGLDRLDRNTGEFIHYPSGPADPNYPNRLSDNRIRRIYQNTEGQLWVVTEGAGVNVIDPYRKPFLRYRNDPANPNSLSAGIIRGLYQDRDGIVWVGTLAGGLDRFDLTTRQVTHYRRDPDNPNSLVSNTVFDITQDHMGYLWIGTINGVSKLDPNTGNFVNYQHDPDNSNSLSDNAVVSILEDRNNMLWFATWGGLDRFDPETETFTHYTHDAENPASLSSDVLIQLYEDSNGTLWVSTESQGLNRFDATTKTFQHYLNDPNDPNSLSDNTVTSIYEDENGMFWFATLSSGLNRFDPATNQFTRYGVREGLSDTQIVCILPDDNGNLWLSTGTGWTRVDMQTTTFTKYDHTDGLPSQGATLDSCTGDPSGQLFFGSLEGLVGFFPQDIIDNSVPPQVIISEIQLDHAPVLVGADSPLREAINYTNTLELPVGTNTLSLTFAALSYRVPTKNQYQYKLTGFDNNWTTAGSNQHFATYTNLPPGEYTFHVIASNGDSMWNDVGRTLKIVVPPQWWQTVWFRGGIVLASAGLLTIGYYVHTTNLRGRNRELEKQVAKRTSELSTLLKVSQNVGSTLELEPLLELILEQLDSVIDYDEASIHTVRGDQLSLQAVKRRTSADSSTDSPADNNYLDPEENRLSYNPALNRVVTTQTFVYIPDLLAAGQELEGKNGAARSNNSETILRPQRSWLAVPVIYMGRVLGVLTFTHSQPNVFSPNEQRLAQTFANYVAYAIANAQYHEQAQQEVVTAERQYITREMHDSLSQTLFAANATVLSLLRVVDESNPAAKMSTIELVDLINQAQAEMRYLLTELRSQSTNSIMLYDSLIQLCRDFRVRWKGEMTLDIQEIPALQGEINQAFYYITQEALSNIEKHARADSVYVKLAIINEQLTLEINDNGIGFDPSINISGHFGQGIMRERAEGIGAELEVSSQLGSGTKLVLRCALRKSEALERSNRVER